MSSPQPSRLAEAQERRQIVAGLLAAVGRRGPLALQEADVIAATDLTADSFHRHFRDLDECFDFSCEAALDVLLGPMVAAWSVPRPRPERLGAALAALLGALAAEPRLAELCLLHSPARQADRRTYRRAVDSLSELLLDVRRPPDSPGYPPSEAGEAALAEGAVGLIAARLAAGEGEDLQELRPRLLAALVPALELSGTDWPNVPGSVG
jgi:AcrR family transcriptional regulator